MLLLVGWLNPLIGHMCFVELIGSIHDNSACYEQQAEDQVFDAAPQTSTWRGAEATAKLERRSDQTSWLRALQTG